MQRPLLTLLLAAGLARSTGDVDTAARSEKRAGRRAWGVIALAFAGTHTQIGGWTLGGILVHNAALRARYGLTLEDVGSEQAAVRRPGVEVALGPGSVAIAF